MKIKSKIKVVGGYEGSTSTELVLNSAIKELEDEGYELVSIYAEADKHVLHFAKSECCGQCDHE